MNTLIRTVFSGFLVAVILGGCAGLQQTVNTKDQQITTIEKENNEWRRKSIGDAEKTEMRIEKPKYSAEIIDAEFAEKKEFSPINVTPFTSFTNPEIAKTNDYRNCYTRIKITSKFADIGAGPQGSGGEVLPYEPRNAFVRFWTGFKRDVNLTAKIKIGEYETTATLITLSRQSNSDGEVWYRNINYNLLDFPIFLVKEDGSASVPRIHIDCIGNNDFSSNVAGVALQAATTAIQQVSPTAKVLTRLTEQSMKDTARAIDTVIAKLFSSSINEGHGWDSDFRTWDINSGVHVDLHIPKDDKSWKSDRDILRSVGTWTIGFDIPRPSIFSDRRICPEGNLCSDNRGEALDIIHKEINPGQVLNYPLVKNNNGLGTIRAYLVQQKWFLSALSAFKEVPPVGDPKKEEVEATNKKTAEALCRNIYDDITSLGLNGDDADIVIWASAYGLPELNSITIDLFKTADTCWKSLTAVGDWVKKPAAPVVPPA